MAWFCRVHRLGHAAAARGVWACDVSDANACLFSLSIRNDVDTCAELNAACRGSCTGSDGADARYSAAEAPIRALEGEASRSRLRQLHLTAFPAGGSRPEQAFGAVQGKGRFLRGLHP